MSVSNKFNDDFEDLSAEDLAVIDQIEKDHKWRKSLTAHETTDVAVTVQECKNYDLHTVTEKLDFIKRKKKMEEYKKKKEQFNLEGHLNVDWKSGKTSDSHYGPSPKPLRTAKMKKDNLVWILETIDPCGDSGSCNWGTCDCSPYQDWVQKPGKSPPSPPLPPS